MTMGSQSLWLRLMISLCVLRNIYSDMDLVDDPERQIPEFLFECDTEPWITDCKSDVTRKFFMLIDEKGNYLEEVTNKRDPSNSTRLVSHRRKAERPALQEITETLAYPSFLFQLQSEDFSTGTFYISTSSGKLLTADDQNSPDLVLTKDKCTIFSDNNSEVSPSAKSSNPGLSLVISSQYDCDQAKWKLWKIDDKFISIESNYKREFFLDVRKDKVVNLDGTKEKMTGIKTSFLTGQMVTLDRTASEPPEEGIGREDYGDVVLHYTDRQGIDQEAYVCDYEWGLEDANSICRHLNYEAGIPTYDGKYSETKSPEYAVSGVRCDGEFKECKFRTICGTSDPNCLVQQSMKQFKGKGYACNKGSKTDAAGVICGNQTTITSLLQEQIKCKRGSIEKDKKSVAEMYNLQKQVSATGSKMFENKHWSEYLLPMPMAISLMSTLLLVSSQFDRDVELTKPSSGQWEHLKYDWLQANLLFMSNNVKNNFQLSTLNMGVIKVNSRKVHANMKLAVGYAFSTDKFDSKTLLPRHLRYIEEDAAKSNKKAEEVSSAFGKTGEIIEELLEALKNSESFHGDEKVELENVLKIVKEGNKKDKERLTAEKKKKANYDEKVEKSRKEFFQAAEEAFNTQCVDGTLECMTGCKHKPAAKTGKCLIEEIKVCEKYEHTCVKEEKICVKEERRCQGQETYCNGKFLGICTGKSTRCSGYYMHCTKHDHICQDRNSKCIKWKKICTRYEYTIDGNYCLDKGKNGICAPCTWLTEVEATMKSVTQVQMQLQIDAMGDGGSYAGLAAVIQDTVGVTNVFQEDLENFNKWKEDKEKTRLEVSNKTKKTTTITNSTETTVPSRDKNNAQNETKIMNEITPTNKTKITNKPTAEEKEKQQKDRANKNIGTQLRLMQKQLVMEIELLQEIRLPIIPKVSDWLLQLKLLLDELLKRKVKLIEQISEDEKLIFTTLNTKGRSLLEEATKLRDKKEIQFEPSSSADHKIGAQAEKHTENLITRRKTEKNIETLTNKMRNSLREILKSEIKGQDLRATIEYLGECFKHLNFLQLQWDSLRMFFQKLVDFLKDMKTDINRMKDFYSDIGAITLDQPLSKSFKERLQKKIVEGLANNIYVMRIAFFYTKIAEEGLLEKMSMIGSNLKKIESKAKLKRYKKFIEDDAVMTQERIKREISKEEAKINDKITNEVSSIKNKLACQLEDRKKLHKETKLTLEAMDKLLSSENNEKNVIATMESATEEEMQTMTLFDEGKLGLNDIVGDEEEDVDDFMEW